MLTVTPKFLTALRGSHTVAVSATVYRPTAPTTAINVRVIGGQMTCDVDAQVLRQATLEVAFSLTEPLTTDVVRELPFGGYATVSRGIRYADGTTELVQLGRFRIDSVVWGELQGQATLTLSDRTAQLQDEPFTVPWSPTGSKPSDAIVAAVQQVFGSSIAYHVTTTPASEAALTDTVYDQDRVPAIHDLASGINAQVYFDNLGDLVLRPRPVVDQSSTPVWTLDSGATGVLISVDETLDRSSVRNGVAVRAQADPTLPPIYSLATDNTAGSPTLWGGPFGKVAMIVNSTSITSQAQADSTAGSLLNLRLGLSRTLAIRGVPNPALEPGDLILIEHPDGRAELQVVNALTVSLDPTGDMALTTKANWRPQPFPTLAPSRIRYWAGTDLWAELADATLVEA